MKPGLPGSDFCQVPNFGTATRCQRPPDVRSKRSKRIHILRVPCRAGIWPTNTAKRSAGSGPVWQSVSLALSGSGSTGACAPAGTAAARAMKTAVTATLRTPLFNRGVRQKLQRASALGLRVERPVAALGRREAPALRGDRTALDAVGVVHGQVHVAVLGRVVRDLVDPGGTHPRPRLGDLAGNV